LNRLDKRIPVRIVSLLAGATETICELGAADCLVGRSHECDNPSWVKSLPSCTRPAFDINTSSREIDTEVRRRLRGGEPLYYVETDLIKSLNPDLLIAQAHCEVCAVTPDDIQRAGCATIGAKILPLQAGSLEGIFTDITTIADAIARPEAGQALIDRLRRRLRSLQQKVDNRRRPTLVMLEWTDPIFPMSNWGPELAELAGAQLLLGQPRVHSRAIEWSDVRQANPEVLIIAPCGFSLDRAVKELPIIENYPGWFDLRAVQEGKVFFADGNLYFNRSGPTVVDTAEMIADILHGTQFHAPLDSRGSWTQLPPPKEIIP
jgi:iron complex transport system substrate-binding protein